MTLSFEEYFPDAPEGLQPADATIPPDGDLMPVEPMSVSTEQPPSPQPGADPCQALRDSLRRYDEIAARIEAATIAAIRKQLEAGRQQILDALNSCERAKKPAV